MFRLADLPDVIPVFPLSGALLLPRARLPLHIFEPRYLAMLDDVLKTPDRMLGMVQPIPGREDDLHMIGCAGRLVQFSETDDGRYMITLNGVSRFKVSVEVEGFQPYRRARVDWVPFERDLGPQEHDPRFQREPFMALLRRFFDANGLSTDWDSLAKAEDEMLLNSLSMMLDLPYEDKQALLEAPSLETRRETLTTLMEFALMSGQNEDRMQ